MQVSVEAGEGLKRKLTIQIPSDRLDSEVQNRLKSLQGRVKIDGFRPGKVPLNVVRQRYGQQVLQEVAGEIMEHSFRDAVTQENLRPAGDPVISTQAIKPGQPLEYTATFEVYPELTLAPVAELKIVQITSSVSESDVDSMLQTLRKQRTDWQEVERAAATGDRVTLDFVGTVDAVAFEGGSANGVQLELGSGSMIPGFEEQIIGVGKGGNATVKVTFPADYHAADLKGKDAEFAVTVTLVEEPQVPELDDDFAKGFGIDSGLDKLKADIRANMERELGNRLSASVKNEVMDRLVEANPVDVPQAIVQQEAESLKKNASVQQPEAKLTTELFMPDASRRVQLGMILAEIIKSSGIQVPADRVVERITTISKDYEDPDEVVRYYQGNPQMLRSIETLVMEDMVVEWVVSQANVSTKEKTFDEVMNPGPAA